MKSIVGAGNKPTLDLIWAERVTDGPYNVVNNGDQIKVTVRITQD